MRRIEEGKLIKETYESLEDLLLHFENTPLSKDFLNASQSTSNNEWSGSNSFEEALNLLAKGDAKTAKKVREKFNDFKLESALHETIKRDEYYYSDEVGIGLFDVGTFLTGEPEYWLNVEEVEGHKNRRIINIYLNLTTSGGVSKDDFLIKGAAIVKLTELLELHGYGVNVYGLSSVKAQNRHSSGEVRELHVSIKLKDSTQALDFERLSFAAANVTFYRRIIFRQQETRSGAERREFDIEGTYGHIVEHHIKKDDPNGIYIESSLYGKTDKWEAWVLDQLKKQGIKV